MSLEHDQMSLLGIQLNDTVDCLDTIVQKNVFSLFFVLISDPQCVPVPTQEDRENG